MLNCVFALHVELAVFFQEHQHCHADCFENSEFILILAYMTDILGALNHLNQQMQGGRVNIIKAEEHLKALKKKSNYGNDEQRMLTLLDDCKSEIEDVSGNGNISIPTELKQAISLHLDEPTKSLDRESYPAWVRQLFAFSVDTANVNGKYSDEIIELQ